MATTVSNLQLNSEAVGIGMEEYSIAPRNEVAAHLSKIDFDSVVVITYNRKTNQSTNWWHFSGHPDYWGGTELKHLAWQLTSHTADRFKSDVADPDSRAFKSETKKFIVSMGPKLSVSKTMMLLAAVGMDLWNPEKRLWLWLELSLGEMGVSIRRFDGVEEESGKEYWSWGVLLGPLVFRVTRRK